MPKRNSIPGLTANSYTTAKGVRKISSWMYQPPWLDREAPRPKAIRLGTKSREEAAAMVATIKAQAMRLDRSDHLSVLMGKAITEKLARGEWRDSTAVNAQTTVRKLVAFAGDRKPEFLSGEVLRDWFKEQLAEGASPASAHHHIRNVRSLFATMMSMGLAFANPASALKLPSYTKTKREQFCTLEQRDLIIGSTDREDLRLVFLLGFHAGLRIGEIIAARPEWLHVSGGAGHLTVSGSADWQTKTNRDRSIPLSRRVLEHLEAHPPAGEWLVRPDVRAGRDSRLRWNPRRPFKEHVAGLGLPWVSPHTMRHTFGSLHAIAGTPEIKIRRWLGITAQTYELHYAGLDPHDDAINL